MNELPTGWIEVNLGKLITGFEAGRNLRAQGRPAALGELGVLKISAVTWGSFDPQENKALNAGDTPRPHERVRRDDLLISRANTSQLVGAVVLTDRDYPWLMLPDKILRLCCRDELVNRRYLLHALRAHRVREYFEHNATGTSHSMRNLSQPKLEQAPVLLPPLPEQRRIVEKIDALLAPVNSARERLARVPAILKRFRQSVLAAACSGRLTEHWRPGRAASADGNEALPEGWVWSVGRNLYLDARYGTSAKCDREPAGGIPVLRVPNIAKGIIDLSDLKYAPPSSERDWKRLEVRSGDILVCRTNGSIDLVGKAAVAPELNRLHAFASYLIRLRVDTSKLSPAYFHAVLCSPAGRAQMTDRARTTAGQFNLNLEILGDAMIPLPSLAEQHDIVRRVGALFKLADAIERRYAHASARTDKVTQAILAKAFRGDLVPQDPSDEPASVMLERATQQSAPPQRTRRRRA